MKPCSKILVKQKDFKVLHVDSDCKLQDFLKGSFKRGQALYEFRYDENISEDKIVMLMSKVIINKDSY